VGGGVGEGGSYLPFGSLYSWLWSRAVIGLRPSRGVAGPLHAEGAREAAKGEGSEGGGLYWEGKGAQRGSGIPSAATGGRPKPAAEGSTAKSGRPGEG